MFVLRWESAGSPIRRPKTMWAPNRAAFFLCAASPLVSNVDLVFIALQRTPLRFLRSPSHAVHQAPDMVRMVADSELAFDHLGNARRAPQMGPVTLRRRSLQKQRISRFLSEALSSRDARRKAHVQGAGPAQRRASRQRITELGLHPIRRPTSWRELPASRQCQRASPPVLQKTGASLQPGHRYSEPQYHYCIIYAGVNRCSLCILLGLPPIPGQTPMERSDQPQARRTG